MQASPPNSLVERAVREAVDALAAPRVRNALLALALRWARLDAIPGRGSAVGDFVRGPLFLAAEQFLGLGAAESMLEQLAPMARLLEEQEESSGGAPPLEEADEEDFPVITVTPPPRVHGSALGDRPRFATDPAPASLLTVLVASVDPAGVEEVGHALAGVASVQPVTDALAVLEHLERRDASMVVVDCRRPAMSVETLVALAPELPEDTRILLWGERHDLEARMRAMGTPIPSAWVCCGPQASAEDVGAIVRILME